MSFRPKVEPRPYQRSAVAWLAKRGHGALLLDTRTGKTKIAIDWLSWLNVNRRLTTAVVICPKIAIDVWLNELKANWWGDAYTVYDLRHDYANPRKNSLAGQWPSPKTWTHEHMRIVLIPVSVFSRECVKVMRGIHSLNPARSACVLDESHLIKTPASKRSRRIAGLGKYFEYRLAMTATPVSKRGKIDEVYPQWRFIDPSVTDKWPTARSFREYFGLWDESMGWPRFIGPIHTAEYAELIASQSIALSREDALGLEPVEHHYHEVEMPQDLRDLYKALVKDKPYALAEAGLEPPEHIFGKFIMSQRMADGCVPTADGHYKVWGHKLGLMLSLLTDKTIVCCNFLAELRMVRRHIERAGRPVIVVSGATKDKNGELERFLETDRAVLVVQPSVVAVAVDLASADRVVWFSVPTSWILYRQMSDRIALNPRQPQSHMIVTTGTSDVSLKEGLVEARGYRQDLLREPEKFLAGGLYK